MSPVYNENYYDGINVRQMRPRVSAFKTYIMRDGTLVGFFQGERGARPDLDFVIKILIPGADKKLEPPTHTYWVVDLLLKIPQFRNEVREIIVFYIDYYDRTSPFASVEERNNYETETVQDILTRFNQLEQPYTLSLDYVATMIELFCKNEKASPNAYMFRNLLVAIRDYIDGRKHYTEVLKAAQPGFRN